MNLQVLLYRIKANVSILSRKWLTFIAQPAYQACMMTTIPASLIPQWFQWLTYKTVMPPLIT